MAEADGDNSSDMIMWWWYQLWWWQLCMMMTTMMMTTMMMAMTMMVMTNHPQTTFFGGLMRQTQLWNIFWERGSFFGRKGNIYLWSPSSEKFFEKCILEWIWETISWLAPAIVNEGFYIVRGPCPRATTFVSPNQEYNFSASMATSLELKFTSYLINFIKRCAPLSRISV